MPRPFRYILLFCLLSFSVSGYAQHVSRLQPIQVKESALGLKSMPHDRLKETGTWLHAIPKNSRWLIQFARLPNTTKKQQLAAQGLVLLDYIPSHSFLAQFDQGWSVDALKNAGILAIWSPDLLPKMEQVTNQQRANTTPHRYHLWMTNAAIPSAQITVLENALQQHKAASLGSFQWLYPRMLECDLTPAQRDIVLTLSDVLYILPAPELRELNLVGTDQHGANLLHMGAGAVPWLTGNGITIGMGDGGRTYHIDNGFYETGQSYAGNTHATHVAGTLAGKGLINPDMKGFAFNGTVVVDYFNTIINRTSALYQQQRMVLTNNSYGGGSSCLPYSGQYSGYCGQVDQQLLDMPHLMHVFAGGNAGNLTCSPFPTSYRTIDNAFQAAKNVLTVGGTNPSGSVNVYSKGPTLDGRVKPEIVAVSTEVLSTITNNNYGRLDGTSMATPQVTGALALLYERYRQLFSDADPDGDLMKALVCNTATDVGTKYVDFANGYGWLNLPKALSTLNQKTWFSGAVSHDEEQTFEVNLDHEVTDLKIMVYWHDQPASYYSVKTLVNDLDITVQLPDGSIYDPFVLDTSLAGVLQQAVRGKDRLNNIEQVVIDRAVPGTYTIRVKGFEVPYGPQAFKVVYNWNEPVLQLLQPAGGEKYKASQTRVVQWNFAGHETDNYQFFYSVDAGVNWTPATVANRQGTRATWAVPTLNSAAVLFKIVHTATLQEQVSAPFAVLPEPSFTLSSPCRNTVVINWVKPAGIDSVAVYLLSGKEMQQQVISTGTSHTLSNLPTGKTVYASVQSIKNQITGTRAIAKGVVLSTTACTASGPANDISISAVDSLLFKRSTNSIDMLPLLKVYLKNNGNAALTTQVRMHWYGESGLIASDTLTRTWSAGEQVTYTTRFRVPATPGTHQYRIIASSTTDPNPANDTTRVRWRYLDPSPISLPFLANYETAGDTSYRTIFNGLIGAEELDIQQLTPAVQLQSGDGIIINTKIDGQFIELIGNYNLATYSTTDDIRMALDIPDLLNMRVDAFIRGADTLNWLSVPLFNPFTLAPALEHININRILAAAAQPLGKSFQVRLRFTANGYQTSLRALQEIRFFTPAADISLPYLAYSKDRLTDGDSLRVGLWVTNNGKTASGAVQVSLNSPTGGDRNTTIADIAAGDTVVVYYTVPVSEWPEPVVLLRGWISHPTDPNKTDDTLATQITYFKKINKYPYREGFENSKGNWASSFLFERSTQLGESIAPFRAANGQQFIGTRYVDVVQGVGLAVNSGVLMSPLFDISGLQQPHLSFSFNRQLCDNKDSVFLEYSVDTARTWFRILPSAGNTNWYGASDGLAWKGCAPHFNRWRVHSAELPTGQKSIQFRVVNLGRPAFAGIFPVKPGGPLLDDFHLFNRDYTIFKDGSINADAVATNAGNTISLIRNGSIAAELNSPRSTRVNWSRSPITDGDNLDGNPVLPLNWAITTSGGNLDSGIAKLFVTDQQVEQWLEGHPCDTCSQPPGAYDLTLFRYGGAATTINHKLADNQPGHLSIWDPNGFDLVPYESGYYVEINSSIQGEYYLGWNKGLVAVSLSAAPGTTEQTAKLNWEAASWIGAQQLVLERSASPDAGYQPVFSQMTPVNGSFNGQLVDPLPDAAGTYYYRLKITYEDGTVRYSVIRRLDFNTNMGVQVFPNPGTAGSTYLAVGGMQGQRVQVHIYNSEGRMLGSANYTIAVNQFTVSLQSLTKRLPAGMYWVTVQGDQQKKTLRLVISGN